MDPIAGVCSKLSARGLSRVEYEREVAMTVGFIGLGVMGQPMALNLARAGISLIVWNRSPGRAEPLRAAGADAAGSVDELFDRASLVCLMLANAAAVDEVLGRATSAFARLVNKCTVVNMGTTSPEYSKRLSADIAAAGGRYVEAPMSGSRKPAEEGELVAMLAGSTEAVEDVRAVLHPLCSQAIACGAVPNALLMKLSVNLFLITMVTGLAEAVHFARQHELDLDQLFAVLDAGPMASDVSRTKARKLIDGDFAVQAEMTDVLMNNRLIADAAHSIAASSPLLDVCHALYEEAIGLGAAGLDMVAVTRAIEARTRAL